MDDNRTSSGLHLPPGSEVLLSKTSDPDLVPEDFQMALTIGVTLAQAVAVHHLTGDEKVSEVPMLADLVGLVRGLVDAGLKGEGDVPAHITAQLQVEMDEYQPETGDDAPEGPSGDR